MWGIHELQDRTRVEARVDQLREQVAKRKEAVGVEQQVKKGLFIPRTSLLENVRAMWKLFWSLALVVLTAAALVLVADWLF